jgi:G3E family GTPase
MKIIILGGFLGSGKTTLLMQLAPYLAGFAPDVKYPVVVLENEISTTDVDAQMLQDRGMEVRTLTAGCICCTSTQSLLDSLREIHALYEPAYLIIEATGMAFPDSIANTLRECGEQDITIIAMADARRWHKVMRAMPQFLESQLSESKLVFLNKTDLVSPDETETVLQSLKSLTKDAVIYPVCARSGIPVTCFDSLI